MSQSGKQDMERVGPLWGVMGGIALAVAVWVVVITETGTVWHMAAQNMVERGRR
jgi:hypothetical protein